MGEFFKYFLVVAVLSTIVLFLLKRFIEENNFELVIEEEPEPVMVVINYY